jgi:uncharacterized protein
MSAGPLPHRVNIRKAVTRSARYAGCLGAEQLPQFSSLLNPADPQFSAEVEFGQDDEGRQYASVILNAKVVLECQRCLQPMLRDLSSESRLALVPSDEQAKQLPEDYEPWLAIDEVDLWALAGEELALALPVVAYHPAGECEPPGGTDALGKENEDQGMAGIKPDSPFNVLSALLDSSDTKEK